MAFPRFHLLDQPPRPLVWQLTQWYCLLETVAKIWDISIRYQYGSPSTPWWETQGPFSDLGSASSQGLTYNTGSMRNPMSWSLALAAPFKLNWDWNMLIKWCRVFFLHTIWSNVPTDRSAQLPFWCLFLRDSPHRISQYIRPCIKKSDFLVSCAETTIINLSRHNLRRSKLAAFTPILSSSSICIEASRL